MYLLLLLVGALGFLAMTVLGMAHGIGGAAHSLFGGHNHAGIGHGGHTGGDSAGHIAGHHSAALPNGAAHPTHHTGVHLDVPQSAGWNLLMAVSPLDVFAMAFGGGAVGEIFKSVLDPTTLAACAFAGAIFLDFGVIRPLMGFMMRFASRPSEGLEGQVASIGEAATRFDPQGRGLVKLELDGQIIQLLARLDNSEIENGTTVAKGDKLLVVEVDASRNTCRVSRELAPSLLSEPTQTTTHVRSSS